MLQSIEDQRGSCVVHPCLCHGRAVVGISLNTKTIGSILPRSRWVRWRGPSGWINARCRLAAPSLPIGFTGDSHGVTERDDLQHGSNSRDKERAVRCLGPSGWLNASAIAAAPASSTSHSGYPYVIHAEIGIQRPRTLQINACEVVKGDWIDQCIAKALHASVSNHIF